RPPACGSASKCERLFAALPAALGDLWLRRRDAELRLDSPRTPCWGFLLSGLLFLSSAHSKLVTYVLPLFPARRCWRQRDAQSPFTASQILRKRMGEAA